MFPERVLQSPDAGVETILVLGRPFIVVKKLGDGANSIVYHSINSYVDGMPRQVAVKRSYFDTDNSTAAHEEIDLIQRLADKNIVQCYACEVVRVDGKLSVSAVLEYCGPSLVRHMQNVQLQHGSSLPEALVLQVACCVSSALSYLHSQSPPIAHRDVKPENVLRAESATISSSSVTLASGAASAAGCEEPLFKLCDFGSATTEAYHSTRKQDIQRALADIEAKTTMGYRAPEMADPWTGQRIDERVDVWAFGVLVYYTLFFRLPFGETSLGIINGRLDFPRDPPTSDPSLGVRDGLKRLVRFCLVRETNRRPAIFDVIQFMRTDKDLGPAGASSFPFTCPVKPDDWAPQELAAGSKNMDDSQQTTSTPSDHVACSGGTQPPAHSLFRQLNWTAASSSSTGETSNPSAAPAGGAVMTCASTSLFDDLDSAMFSKARQAQQLQVSSEVSSAIPISGGEDIGVSRKQPPLADLFGDLMFSSNSHFTGAASGDSAKSDPLAAFFSSPARK